jgi:hypothetical protein
VVGDCPVDTLEPVAQAGGSEIRFRDIHDNTRLPGKPGPP